MSICEHFGNQKPSENHRDRQFFGLGERASQRPQSIE